MDAKMERAATGEIQMQSFSDGLPPPPPVSHSWKRMDRWLEDNYEELWENLGEPATLNDVNELEHELDCTLPQEVRESLQIHDGQERGGLPTGVLFGCMLLDCEEIIQEWQNWRTVNEAYFSASAPRSYSIPQAPLKAFAGSSSSAAAVPVAQAQHAGSSAWRQDLLDKQDSQPPNAVQKVYAHPAWIPLARDWGGNNICVDLAPGPAGKWGQVILMGRDYDCKYVISRSWSAFLATVADDMATDKWFIDEETRELKLREFRQSGVEPAYIDILRWRTDQRFGRKRPGKKGLRINSDVAANGKAEHFSPYGSPTHSEERGRSPHRLSTAKAPAHTTTTSPRGHVGSPLARVTEEPQQPPLQPLLQVDTNAPRPEKLIPVETPVAGKSEKAFGSERLVPVDTPVAERENADLAGRHKRDGLQAGQRDSLPKSRLSLSVSSEEVTAPGAAKAEEEEEEEGDGGLKEVEI